MRKHINIYNKSNRNDKIVLVGIFLYENNLNYCCEKNFSPYMAHSPKISIRNGKNRHKTCNMKNSAIHFNYVTMYSTDILPVNWYKSYFVTVGEQLYDM